VLQVLLKGSLFFIEGCEWARTVSPGEKEKGTLSKPFLLEDQEKVLGGARKRSLVFKDRGWTVYLHAKKAPLDRRGCNLALLSVGKEK